MSAAVVYLRMAPALRDALRNHAAESGVSLNAFAVQALAAAAGPSSCVTCYVAATVSSDDEFRTEDGATYLWIFKL
jgi:hypothetical protein